MTVIENPHSAVGAETPLERIEAEIIGLAGSLAAGEAELLRWLAEYDRREGWASWGCKSAAHWLSWKCGDSLHTARERVRVARALEALPRLSAAFAAGEVSYSKVRAITRVATPNDELVWLDVARHETGAGLDRMVASVASIDRAPDAVEQAWRTRRVTATRPARPEQSRLTVDLPIDAAHVVMAALDVLASRLIDDAVDGSGRGRREVIDERGGMPAVRVDALVQLAEQIIADVGPTAAERGEIGRLSLLVEPAALTGEEPDGECALGGKAVDRAVAQRWSCEGRVDQIIEHRCGHRPHQHGRDIGRSSKVVPRRLRRAVLRRDHHRCRFHGCGATAWLHLHHIVHWSAGGETALGNLVSLCSFHHHLVHDGGWSVRLVDDYSVEWTDADGAVRTVEPLPGDGDLPGGRLVDGWVGPMPDVGFAIDVIAEAVWRARHENVPAGTSSLMSAHDRPAMDRRRRRPR